MESLSLNADNFWDLVVSKIIFSTNPVYIQFQELKLNYLIELIDLVYSEHNKYRLQPNDCQPIIHTISE